LSPKFKVADDYGIRVSTIGVENSMGGGNYLTGESVKMTPCFNQPTYPVM
jgi:hypothetical protein